MIRACRENSSAVRTELRVVDLIPMAKGGEEVARGRIPELGAMIRACRKNPSAVRTKSRVVDLILMVKRGLNVSRKVLPELSPCTKIADYGRLLHLIRGLESGPRPLI